MTIQMTTALRNTRLDAITTALGNGALLKVYGGSVPADANTALSGQTLLGTLTCASPPAPAASAGVLTFSAITQDSAADATATATFFRMTTSGGATVLQGSCGVGGSGADLILNTTAIVVGGPIQVTSAVINEANA